MNKYGLEFSTDSGIPTDLSVELSCFRNYAELCKRPGFEKRGRAFHLKNAIKTAFCQNEKGPFVWSPWDDARVEGFLNDKNFVTWWGPAASGKTTSAAAIALCFWLAKPDQATVVVCSTTREALEQRIWGQILRLYQSVDGLPGTLIQSKFKIVLGAENTLNGLFGVAILRGTMKEALGNLSGKHNRYVLLIVDEMQATREAAVEQKENMAAGADEFRFIGIGNPESRLDPLGKYSEPKKGWNSISYMESESWETREGLCQFFSGLKSPGITEPKKFPFLLSKKQIDRTREARGENSPIFWSQRIGFIPAEGLLPTVMSETFIMQYHAMDQMTWLDTYETYAALDPAFSAGGDNAVLSPFSVGNMKDGRTGIYFWPQVKLQLKIGGEKSMTTTLMRDIRDTCTKMGIGPERFAMDCTGMQRMLADLLDDEWGKIYRCLFSTSASEIPISINESTKSKERYKNRVAELWFSVSDFIRFDQLRGLSVEAAKEFCQRLVPDRNQVVLGMESKKDMKKRTGYSPDHADSVAVAIDYVRVVLGIIPGGKAYFKGSRLQPDFSANELDNSEKMFMLPDEMNVNDEHAEMLRSES